jgi:hypothetical protein
MSFSYLAIAMDCRVLVSRLSAAAKLKANFAGYPRQGRDGSAFHRGPDQGRHAMNGSSQVGFNIVP